jgi:DNA invertase Pin-like site-specific DNA recombinase
MTYGYLRVSSDKQDVESQKIGVVKKAEELHVEIDEWIKDEGVSGVKEYSKRHLGELMKKAQSGDTIIVSEISRLARSVFMLFRIVEFCMGNNIIIYSVKDSINTIKKGDLTGIMMVFCFGIAAQIEREMIVKRTVEGLERRRREGVIFGRPPGSAGRKKLDGQEELIRGYNAAGLSARQMARMLKVNRGTLQRFCEEKAIQIEANPCTNLKCNNNRWHEQGKKANELLDAEKEYVITLIDSGLTNKYIIEKLREKGCTLSEASFLRWLKNDRELYGYFIEKIREIRTVRNADCGKQRKHYKF